MRSGKLESDTLVSELASFMSSRMEVAADGSAEGFRPEWRDDAVEEYESEGTEDQMGGGLQHLVRRRGAGDAGGVWGVWPV